MNFVNRLNNLRLATKMLLIAVLATIGLIVPSYFYVTLSLDAQYVAEHEVSGTPPIIKTIKLMKVLGEYRGVSARFISGEKGVVGILGAKNSEVEQGFSDLTKYLLENVDSDKVLEKLAQSKNLWQISKSVASGRDVSEADLFEASSKVILSLNNLVHQLMQYSLLSYDPAAPSYHLIIANFENLPILTDSLGQIRGFGAGILARGVVSPAEKVMIAANLSVLTFPFHDFIENLQSAAASDEKFSGLEKQANEFETEIDNLTAIVRQQILKDGPLNYPSAKYFEEYSLVINRIYSFFDDAVIKLESAIQKRVDHIASERRASLISISVMFLFSAIIAFLLIKSIKDSVSSLTLAFKHISEGKFDFEFDTLRKDEMGELNRKLSELNQQLKKADARAIEAARVKQALDNSATCFMIANNDREIVYLNTSVKGMLRECEDDLREVLPHFTADKVMGEKIDIFHKNPAHQKAILEHLSQKHTAQIQVGKRNFRLLANPVYADNGDRLGTVVEWLDRTKEVMAQTEIAMMVDAALQGDFTKRIDISGKEDFLLTISDGLNHLLDVTENGLTTVSQVLMAIADGDLTKRVETDYQGTFDEMKKACNITSINLTDMIAEILVASETIHNASGEIARGNSDLSSRTEQQASNLEETASSMQQLTGTVRLNADNAKQANALATEASEVAKTGGELIQKVVTTMSSINESSRKISDIIGVIDAIAFQTNILALNAAVEAARAGEQGRGFAVVASEVRTLAQRSANAAKDIKSLISDSVLKIEEGNDLVKKSGETMQNIVVSIQLVNDIMGEIAAASVQQSSGIEEVGKAITQMDEMTQQNAALVEQAAAAAEKMTHQAEQLSRSVGSFTLNENAFKPAKLKEQQSHDSPRLDSQRFTKKALIELPHSDDDEWESF
jgi:methyl-accepting chemotaxis protein